MANRVFITGTITFATAVADDGAFYFNWHGWNNNNPADNCLGIDDVQISSVVPEPDPASVFRLGLGALAGARARRKQPRAISLKRSRHCSHTARFLASRLVCSYAGDAQSL